MCGEGTVLLLVLHVVSPSSGERGRRVLLLWLMLLLLLVKHKWLHRW